MGAWMRWSWQGAATVMALGLAACTVEPTMTVTPAHLQVSAPPNGPGPTVSFEVALLGAPEVSLGVHASAQHTAVATIGFRTIDYRRVEVLLTLREPWELGAGTFEDLVSVKVCADTRCEQQVPGSPREVAVAYTVPQVQPILWNIGPGSAPARPDAGLVLGASGEGFSQDTQLLFDGEPRAVTVASSGLLSAVLVPGDLARVGVRQVVLRNPGPGGGFSGALPFTVFDASAPTLRALSPAAMGLGAPGFTVTVTGEGFNQGSQVFWDGSALVSHLLAPGSLTAEIPASLLTRVGRFPVAVSNASTGGGVSAPLELEVVRAPSIGYFYPLVVYAGDPPYPLLVGGTDVGPSAQLLWDGAPRPVTPLSPNQARVELTPADLASARSIAVQLSNGFPFTSSNVAPLVVRAPTALRPTDAVSSQQDGAHRGAATFRNLAFPAAPAWTVDLGWPVPTPLVAAGRVVVATNDWPQLPQGSWTLRALELGTGTPAWGPTYLGDVPNLAAGRGRVVASGSARALAFDLGTGEQVWLTRTLPDGPGEWAASGVVVDGDAVRLATGGGGAACVTLPLSHEAETWRTPLAGSGAGAPPAVSAEGLFVSAGCATSSLDPDSGVVLWTDPGECTTPPGWPPVVGGGVVYAPADPATSVGRLLDARTGALRGTYLADGPPALGPGGPTVVLKGALTALDPVDGGVRWRFAPDAGLVTAPLAINQYVLAGTADGHLFAVDGTTGLPVWSYALDAGLAGPAVADAPGALRSGMAAGEGVLVVPAGNGLTAFVLSTDP